MELLIWIAFAAVTIVPMFKLLPHFGINPYWAFAGVVPIGTVVLLWVMASKLQELERR